ncbi:MAG: molybdate ABC transporter substrate-binding protein [Eudoraea sp.]|nr:molybdate ABC transporter substrate-binding protein [Eudoraea sp.]
MTIAAASNMQFAIGELSEAFTEMHGIETEIIIGSSGNLTAQIRSGAPYDVFVSADMQYPQYLFERGLGQQIPEIYAYGQLVLWSCKPGIHPKLDSLKSREVAHIAIPNPELAPYGKAAKEVLINQQLYHQITPKLVFGESIAQTNQFIRTGAAELGFTALSVVMSPQLEGAGSWTLLPRDQYTPIAQGILVLSNAQKSPDNAVKFHTFLQSETGQQILNKYGYLSKNE